MFCWKFGYLSWLKLNNSNIPNLGWTDARAKASPLLSALPN